MERCLKPQSLNFVSPILQEEQGWKLVPELDIRREVRSNLRYGIQQAILPFFSNLVFGSEFMACRNVEIWIYQYREKGGGISQNNLSPTLI